MNMSDTETEAMQQFVLLWSAGVFQIVTIITALINITETLTGTPAANRVVAPENAEAHFEVKFSISEST